MKKNLLVLVAVVILFGCSTNQKFDCPYTDGIRCQRLSEIDKEFDKTPQKVSTSQKFLLTKHNKQHSCIKKECRKKPFENTTDDIIQIWIAGYESESGIYHYPSVLNMVIKSDVKKEAAA